MTPYEQARERGDTRGQHEAAKAARRATTARLLEEMRPALTARRMYARIKRALS
jgi:hypothetical protein